MAAEKPLLLIVDDDPQIRDLIESALADSCDILLAEDGQQAQDFYQQMGERIKGVITDVNMPVMDGIALTAWLLEQPSPPPVILMTANDSQLAAEARERWVDMPQVAWLEKPFPIRKLQKLVRSWLPRCLIKQ